MRPNVLQPAGPPVAIAAVPPAERTPRVQPPEPAGPRRPQGGRLDLVLFGLFYALATLAVTGLGRALGVYPALWPTDAAAVGLYFLLFRGALGRIATVVVAVSFFTHFLVFDQSLAMAIGGAMASWLAFTLVALGCERAGMERETLFSVPMVANLAVVAVAGTLPGALIAAFVQYIGGASGFPSLLMRWWLPQMAAVVLLLPPLLLWYSRADEQPDAPGAADSGVADMGAAASRRRDEELALAVFALGASVLTAASSGEPLLLDLGGIILLWFAFRLGLFTTALAACGFSVAVISLALVHVWQVPQETAMTTLLRLESRLVLAALPALLIAAIMAQRARQQREVQEDRRRLAYALEGANDGIWDWHIPSDAVFFSARAHRMLGYDPAGAAASLSDYRDLVHPDDLQGLLKSMKEHATGRQLLYQAEIRIRHRNGTWVWLLERGKVVERDAFGAPVRAVGTLTDISQRKHLEAALEHAASHDPLTGLANRTQFDRALEQARRRLLRDGALFAVLLIDIDHFKSVNDRFGHMAGDLLLSTAARRLQSAIRAGDLVARYGGDEFAMIAAGKSKDEFAALAERLHQHLSRPVEVEGLVLPASFSIGMAVADDKTLDAAALIAEADAALYAAKDAGRDTWRAVGVPAPSRNGRPKPMPASTAATAASGTAVGAPVRTALIAAERQRSDERTQV